MRRTAIAALLVGGLLVAACGDDDDESADTAPTTPATGRDRRAGRHQPPAGAGDAAACADGKTLDRRRAHDRHRRAGVPALRDRRRARDRARASKPPSRWPSPARWASTGDAVKWIRTTFDAAIAARPEGLRLQPPAVHDHARAGRGRRRSASRTTPRTQAIFGLADSPAADATDDRRPAGPQDRRRRPARPASPTSRTSSSPTQDAARLQRQRGRQAGARRQPDRRHRRRPADRVVHHRGRDRGHRGVRSDRRAAAPTQFGLLLEKDNPLVECVNVALATLTDVGRARRDHDGVDGATTPRRRSSRLDADRRRRRCRRPADADPASAVRATAATAQLARRRASAPCCSSSAGRHRSCPLDARLGARRSSRSSTARRSASVFPKLLGPFWYDVQIFLWCAP